MYTSRKVERIECLKIVSFSLLGQGKLQAAEQTMRNAINLVVDQWGSQHSRISEFMHVLEGWLRGWSRKEDADVIREEIEELMEVE